MVVKSGFSNSEVVTKAYLINTNHDLPVFTLNIDERYLYSDTEGMLVVTATIGQPLQLPKTLII